MHAHFCLLTRFLRTCVQLSCILIVFFSTSSIAQSVPADNADRPRIGLVLSGGGARGAAHIGVLKVLEELRIPVDVIVGTSMGAVVGGVYASGMSVAEMEVRIGSIKSEHILSDEIPRQDQTERRKRDDIPNFIGPEFGLKGGTLHLPKGAVAGIGLEALLRNLVQHNDGKHFDSLPVPFRAIATDIADGQMVVLDSGDLVSALRASMSIPGIFAPKVLDGRMLVDGGLVRNLAVDVALQTGVDIIIAVNLGTPLMHRDEVISLLDVSSQVTKIFTEKNVQDSLDLLREKDTLISPRLGDFAASDFNNMAAIISKGEAATRLELLSLARYALSPEAYAEHRAGQQREFKAPEIVIDEIRFSGLQRVNSKVLKARMTTQAGQPLDKAALDADLARIFARGDFSHVGYRVKEGVGKRILIIEIDEKASGPDYLRFGLNLSTDFSGNAHFLALVSHRKTWINNLGAEWRNDLKMGRINQITSEYYQPLNVNQSLFIAPFFDLEQKPFDIYDGNSRVARFARQTTSYGLNLGTEITGFGELRLGPYFGISKFTLDTGPTTLQDDDNSIDIGGARLRLSMDHLDNGQFPRKGYSFFFEALNSQPALGAQDRYTRWEADYLTALSLGEHTLSFALHAGGHFGTPPLPSYDLFQLGGFLKLSGFQAGQLLGQSVRFARLVYSHRITRLPLLQGFFGGVSLETGRVGDPLVASSPRGQVNAGSVFIATDTPIGPAYLGLGHADGGNTAIYFYLGIPI